MDDTKRVLVGIETDRGYWSSKRPDDYSIPLYAIPNIQYAVQGWVRPAGSKWGVIGNTTRLYATMIANGLIEGMSETGKKLSHIRLTDKGKTLLSVD
jgi:hypothetical protein